MEIQHPVARLLVELSKSQDNEVGDGTTGIVVLAGALLEQAEKLLDKGLHPLKISDGFDIAVEIATKRLEEISQEIKFTKEDYSELVDAACVSLGSKIVSNDQKRLAEIAVKAVLTVADLERKDVNLDLIKIQEKTGGSLEDTQLIEGILIDKDFSHPQMPKEVTDAKIAILTCPFEAPKPKTKHNIDITSADAFRKLYQMEQQYFKDMIAHLQKSGCNIALCQWGFEDQANHLLLQNKLPAVRWVGGIDIELIAMATGARIIPRFEEVTAEKLGKAGKIRELHFGTGDEKMLVIEECANCKAVTILVRGGSKMIVEEAERSLHDALCVVSTLIRCNKIVWGGGASEIACSLAVNNYANQIDSTEQYAVRAFADALEQIPMALAENSGLNSLKSLTNSRSKQVETKEPFFGIDCMSRGRTNMKEEKVFETLLSKKGQLQLATQVVKMILKIDDVIEPNVQ